MMWIGVPKERLIGEGRVGLLPDAVRALSDEGHRVLIESGAGERSGIRDANFRAAGAQVTDDVGLLYQRAELIVKVKEPLRSELPYLSSRHILFGFMHLAANAQLVDDLAAIGCMAIAYEGVQTADGSWPILAPMSKIAGRIAVQLGSVFLFQQYGGKGLLLGAEIGSNGGRVVVLGCGVAGRAAIRAAVPLGVHVTAVDKNPDVLAALHDEFGEAIELCISNNETIKSAVLKADLLIGAVLVPGAKAPHLVRSEHVRQMEPGSVIVDIAIDQGGCVETSRPTTYNEPTFVEHGVVHCCVKNLPAAVSRTASQQLTAASFEYVQRIATLGRNALSDDPLLAAAVCVRGNQQ